MHPGGSIAKMWGQGRTDVLGNWKRLLTQAYGWFLTGWAKHLSWKEVAEVLSSSWGGYQPGTEYVLNLYYGRRKTGVREYFSVILVLTGSKCFLTLPFAAVKITSNLEGNIDVGEYRLDS
jgi:hypothetical protein